MYPRLLCLINVREVQHTYGFAFGITIKGLEVSMCI